MVYVPARDTPTPEALRERPDLPQQKMAWLQRRDKESGDLYGFLGAAPRGHVDFSPVRRCAAPEEGRAEGGRIYFCARCAGKA
eukprot:287353-Pyramimonas_sp.AAC.1